jgi:hypothetical protein
LLNSSCLFTEDIDLDAAQGIVFKAILEGMQYQAPDQEHQSMNNTATLLPGGPICPGLDLKADGGESASAGNTHATKPELLQSLADT